MEISTYGPETAQTVLLQMVDQHDLDMIEREVSLIKENNDIDFRMIAIKVNDWFTDLSPWKAPAVFGENTFGDGAKETLAIVLDYCKDSGKKYILGGYSLAGLFALWASYQTDKFDGIVAASPSMWYPGFDDYMKEHKILCPRVYLSLGDKEEKVKNPIVSTVGDKIRNAAQMLTGSGVDCVLEWNQGNHFKDVEIRTAKGFSVILNGGTTSIHNSL